MLTKGWYLNSNQTTRHKQDVCSDVVLFLYLTTNTLLYFKVVLVNNYFFGGKPAASTFLILETLLIRKYLCRMENSVLFLYVETWQTFVKRKILVISPCLIDWVISCCQNPSKTETFVNTNLCYCRNPSNTETFVKRKILARLTFLIVSSPTYTGTSIKRKPQNTETFE